MKKITKATKVRKNQFMLPPILKTKKKTVITKKAASKKVASKYVGGPILDPAPIPVTPPTVIAEIDSTQELVLKAIRKCCGTNLDQPISFDNIARKVNEATDKAHNAATLPIGGKRGPNYQIGRRVKTIRRIGQQLVKQGILIEGTMPRGSGLTNETFQLANVTIQTPMEGQPTDDQPAMAPVVTRVVGRPKAAGGNDSKGRGSAYSGKTIYFHPTKVGKKPANKSREGSLLHSSFEDLAPGISFDQWRGMNPKVKTQFSQRRLYLANWIKAGICFIR